MSFSLEQFKKKRRRLGKWGRRLFWGGLVFMALDMMTPFPTPVRGAFAAWWVFVIGAGAVCYLLSQRLPTSETLDIAKEHQGELRVSDLTSELQVTTGTARKILTSLEKEGYAKAEIRTDSGGQNYQVWVFPEIRDQASF